MFYEIPNRTTKRSGKKEWEKNTDISDEYKRYIYWMHVFHKTSQFSLFLTGKLMSVTLDIESITTENVPVNRNRNFS